MNINQRLIGSITPGRIVIPGPDKFTEAFAINGIGGVIESTLIGPPEISLTIVRSSPFDEKGINDAIPIIIILAKIMTLRVVVIKRFFNQGLITIGISQVLIV